MNPERETPMTILEEIIASVRRDLELARIRMPETRLAEFARDVPRPADFAASLRPAGDGRPRIIAEIKRASPSKGMIRPDFGVVSLARELAQAGAAALSVLTETRFFLGSPEYLRAAVANVAIPVLRKDFIVDRYQLYEARAWGASAVLLIAAALEADAFTRLLREARDLGLDVLAEVHDERELDLALESGADIVGVNSRNLKTFEVDLNVTRRLLQRIPDGIIRVAESGVRTADDIRRLQDAGAHAFLVGETLMRAPSPGAALAELLGRSETDPRRSAAGTVRRAVASGLGILL